MGYPHSRRAELLLCQLERARRDRSSADKASEYMPVRLSYPIQAFRATAIASVTKPAPKVD